MTFWFGEGTYLIGVTPNKMGCKARRIYLIKIVTSCIRRKHSCCKSTRCRLPFRGLVAPAMQESETCAIGVHEQMISIHQDFFLGKECGSVCQGKQHVMLSGKQIILYNPIS